ncbi:RidA family protein [Pseudonocardia lacus]|uniref:RidA family protein n=1 Tax=Pseudonocardia lacus TaxID=2835865 RepID=UPI001BDD85AF|nr:RidA family protein [Pseudonocardia lacus]
MSFDRINPPDLAPPSGFSHAVRTDRPRTVYLAGQTALDASGKIVGADVVEQFEKALSNILRALEAAGGTPADLTSITIYIVDVEAYLARAREIGRVWRRLAGTDYPAAAGIGVARLWDAEALVEIQGIAALE